MTAPDKRLNAYRPDIADARLRGLVEAESFAEGRLLQVIDPLVSVRREPRAGAMQLTEALLGETLRVFDEREGWAFVQLARDGYVGYVAAGALSSDIWTSTHRVAVPSTFMYPAPNLKTQPVIAITLNAAVAVTGGDQHFAGLSNGRFVYASHLKPLSEVEPDFVAVAQRFLHVPYYWGGKSVRGLDCSGLVQLSLEACGVACPRDSDMQEERLGHHLHINDLDGLKRGDLVYWNAHTGIMTDERTLLHVNGHHMLTVAEPLREAVERIAASGSQISSLKRL